MAYGNNRVGAQKRTSFRQVGGSVIIFKHPYLAGQISPESSVDEIDVSSSLQLDGTGLEAQQSIDSSKQVVTIDGSVITITNTLLNGQITLNCYPTTGKVATGDMIAACQLIRSVGDSVGGILIVNEFINGERQTTLFYGVTVVKCPDKILTGNDVPMYAVVLGYAGWISAIGNNDGVNKKAIWAVGSKVLDEYREGTHTYSPYLVQNSSGTGGTGESPLGAVDIGLVSQADWQDKADSSGENVPIPPNVDVPESATAGSQTEADQAGGG